MPDGALYENSSATVWLRAGVVPPAARSAMAIVAAERVKVLAIACSPALTGRPCPAPRASVWARGPAAMCDGAQRTSDLSPRPLQCGGRSLLRLTSSEPEGRPSAGHDNARSAVFLDNAIQCSG